jgi:hypothetical protein
VPGNALYSGVRFISSTINDFIKISTVSNQGSGWIVECDDTQPTARTPDLTQIVSNATLGGKVSKNNSIRVRYFKFAKPGGLGTPTASDTLSVVMPQGAFITSVIWYNNGSLTSTQSVNFQLKDGLGYVISSQAGALNTAWYTVDNVGYQLDNTKNTLTLSDANAVADQNSVDVWCMLSYVFG